MAMIVRGEKYAGAIQTHLPRALLSVGSVLIVGSFLQFFGLPSGNVWGASEAVGEAFIQA
ncbi:MULTISPECIES: hypothetical protein [Pseudomonas]|uniref:hypothetical protein n=1 Tax=Pseudomonas TaxID=286 RepID=UPI0006D44203|nr:MULTISPECIES: hypothetical protein [Pseudomonas]OBY93049.1 hypothetical protein A6723_007745 [Pseudomonas sp. AU11447]